jgi:hypothetical protein
VRRVLQIAIVLGLVLVAAACGPPGPKKYDVAKTRACLAATPHVKVLAPPASDFVANTALGGSFRAVLRDNWLTISFGDTVANAQNIATAYRNAAFKNVRAGIDDVLRSNGNAVMLWHKHPSDRDLALVQDCLKT